MKREKLKAKTRASYDATQACTLKRVEVNLCYEVGITQFARISRFLFAAETFSATLAAWGDLGWLEVGQSVIHNRLSTDMHLLRGLQTPVFVRYAKASRPLCLLPHGPRSQRFRRRLPSCCAMLHL